MLKEIDVKNCRLTGDVLHIQFTNGSSYAFPLAEILVQCVGGLTKRAVDPPSALVCTCAASRVLHEKGCPAGNTAGN